MSGSTENKRGTNTLFIGANFFSHDASIFMIDPEHREIFALAEERLTRYKHDDAQPLKALRRALSYQKIDPDTVETVVLCSSFTSVKIFRENAKIIDARILMREVHNAKYKHEYEEISKKFNSLPPEEKLKRIESSPLYQKLQSIMNEPDSIVSMDKYFYNKVSQIFKNAIIHEHFFDHELSHAVSSLYSSDYESGLLITMDGSGDNTFSHVYTARNGEFHEFSVSPRGSLPEGLAHILFYDKIYAWSIGSIYSWFTKHLGFHWGDEGKVEALAAYGTVVKEIFDTLREQIIINDQTHTIDINHDRLGDLINQEKMAAWLELHKKEDIAATIQGILEDVVVEYVANLVKVTGESNIMLSGGVFANVILNLKLYENVTKNISVTPAMADDGSAQGAAILGMLNSGYSSRDLQWLKQKRMPYFGASYNRNDVEAALDSFGDQVDVQYIGDNWPEEVAEFVLRLRVGGIFHGRMEWGPRALGNRSILADPREQSIKALLNETIKKRTSFQPFCPSMLIEERERLFEDSYENLHMTCAFRMRREYWDALPGVIHVDGTARVQFLNEKDNQNYYRVLKRVKDITGFGVLINTSYNKHGRSMVESPKDAITDFLDTNMPFTCIEGYLITRK